MTIRFWKKDSGRGAYCVGTIPDGAYNSDTCIFVPERPTPYHKWDNDAKEWTTDLEDKKVWIRPIRNEELTRVDKFVMPDYYAEFTEDQQGQITAYRQALRDAPDHETVEEIVMPDCPEFMQ